MNRPNRRPQPLNLQHPNKSVVSANVSGRVLMQYIQVNRRPRAHSDSGETAVGVMDPSSSKWRVAPTFEDDHLEAAFLKAHSNKNLLRRSNHLEAAFRSNFDAEPLIEETTSAPRSSYIFRVLTKVSDWKRDSS